jgi:hypothetical protein
LTLSRYGSACCNLESCRRVCRLPSAVCRLPSAVSLASCRPWGVTSLDGSTGSSYSLCRRWEEKRCQLEGLIVCHRWVFRERRPIGLLLIMWRALPSLAVSRSNVAQPPSPALSRSQSKGGLRCVVSFGSQTVWTRDYPSSSERGRWRLATTLICRRGKGRFVRRGKKNFVTLVSQSSVSETPVGGCHHFGGCVVVIFPAYESIRQTRQSKTEADRRREQPVTTVKTRIIEWNGIGLELCDCPSMRCGLYAGRGVVDSLEPT